LGILLLAGLLVVLLFSVVIAYGAPFLPTLTSKVEDALDLLDLKSGQTMLELGCGDGRLLIAASKRGINSVGYELNPLLYLYAKARTWKYRSYATVKLGNYWSMKWPEADGMYVFLLQPYMSKLHKNVVQYTKGRKLKLVSFAFEITEIKPTKEINGMFLYKYSGRD
jgi:SAM-dependent methyltransferase